MSNIYRNSDASGGLWCFSHNSKRAIAAAPSRKKLRDFVQQQPPLHVREIF
ncbi:hypothetical protein PROPEN_02505 [Proteus penneri ATCC 35198]|nr:hypothetical protein PROPEN_02505 [Proteus penneri ATCC 35198]